MALKRFKHLLKKTAFGRHVAVRWRRSRARFEDWRTARDWRASGGPVPPPPFVKHRIVRDYAKRYGLRVFVETGTHRGDMVEAMRRHVNRVISIELDPTLHRRAHERFARDSAVTIVCGDSAEQLPRILATVDTPTLFWLDGHYSGGDTARAATDTPIRHELEHVLGHTIAGHVILIDDARLFDGSHDYPTVAEVTALVRARRPGATAEVADDIIRIV